jgi:hypothetical protein
MTKDPRFEGLHLAAIQHQEKRVTNIMRSIATGSRTVLDYMTTDPEITRV